MYYYSKNWLKCKYLDTNSGVVRERQKGIIPNFKYQQEAVISLVSNKNLTLRQISNRKIRTLESREFYSVT